MIDRCFGNQVWRSYDRDNIKSPPRTSIPSPLRATTTGSGNAAVPYFVDLHTRYTRVCSIHCVRLGNDDAVSDFRFFLIVSCLPCVYVHEYGGFFFFFVLPNSEGRVSPDVVYARVNRAHVY